MGTEGGPLTRVVGELVEQTGLPCAGFTYTHVGGQFMYAADHECYTPIMMNFMRKSRSLSVRGESTERGDPTYHRSRVVLWHPRRSQSKPWQSWSWSRVTMDGASVSGRGRDSAFGLSRTARPLWPRPVVPAVGPLRRPTLHVRSWRLKLALPTLAPPRSLHSVLELELELEFEA